MMRMKSEDFFDDELQARNPFCKWRKEEMKEKQKDR
jgi:hypothetical protein